MRKINVLMVFIAVDVSACSTFHPVPDSTSTLPDRYIEEYVGVPPDNGSIDKRQYIDAYSSFSTLALIASGKDAKPEDIKKYMYAGFSLSDMYCALYFRELTKQQAMLDWQRTQINLASGLATGLLGIFSSSSAATGATGAVLSFFGATTDNVNTTFLLAPKIESLEYLVQKTHTQYVSTLKDSDYIYFSQAQSLINRYAGMCTFRGLKELIDESVSTAKPTGSSGLVTINGAGASVVDSTGTNPANQPKQSAPAPASGGAAAN
jgi:hypothetical protein